MKVFVVGPPRSGTSMTAGLLARCGLDLGDNVLRGNRWNVKGHYENRDMVQINNEILDRLGGHWHTPPAYPIRWWLDPKFDDLKERARGIKATLMKDPRTSLTIPFWYNVFLKEEDVKMVICLRQAISIAKSLERKHWFERERSLELIKDYDWCIRQHTERQLGGLNHAYAMYESTLKDPVDAMKGLDAILELGLKINKGEILKFVDKKLDHSNEELPKKTENSIGGLGIPGGKNVKGDLGQTS